MGKPHLAHQIVGLECRLQIFLVDADRAAHQHMLWPFRNFASNFEEVGTFQGLEAKEVVIVIPRVVNFGIDLVRIFHDIVVSALAQQGRWSACLVFKLIKQRSDLSNVAGCALVKSVDAYTVGK